MHLDGTGVSEIHTGIGFFDHMLTLFSFHSGIDLTLHANGDLQVCDHHTVEDCGIAMGACLKEALQDKSCLLYTSIQCGHCNLKALTKLTKQVFLRYLYIIENQLGC